jgi:hypothetical protein
MSVESNVIEQNPEGLLERSKERLAKALDNLETILDNKANSYSKFVDIKKYQILEKELHEKNEINLKLTKNIEKLSSDYSNMQLKKEEVVALLDENIKRLEQLISSQNANS